MSKERELNITAIFAQLQEDLDAETGVSPRLQQALLVAYKRTIEEIKGDSR